MRFAFAERLIAAMAEPATCPPHEWVDRTPSSSTALLLQCAKNPAHRWPERRR